MSPSVAADLESPLSVGMRVSVLQPFWIAMIIFCWKVKLLKLTSVTLANICGTNSHNWWAKGLPGVGVVKIVYNSDSSGWKSFWLLDFDSTALIFSCDIIRRMFIWICLQFRINKHVYCDNRLANKGDLWIRISFFLLAKIRRDIK